MKSFELIHTGLVKMDVSIKFGYGKLEYVGFKLKESH